MQFTDRILRCVGCGADFLFTIEEQRELVSRGLTPRRRFCQACRSSGEMGLGCEGRVKWFDERKGYGFIEWDEGEDVFVHYSSIHDQRFRTLKEGEKVRFRVAKDARGLQALDVIRVSEAPSVFHFYSATRMANP